jgi:UDP-glucose 4-epimerase
MRVLVTGASGFIGSKLVDRLVRDGHSVVSIDKQKSRHTSVQHLSLDISSPDFLEKCILQDSIDVIYHLAAQSGGYYSLVNPYEDCLWNSIGTLNIVKLAQLLEVRKFVYISSMAIYGNGDNVTEETPPMPISFYGASKLSGEYITKLIKEHSNIPYTIYRLFATYGFGQDLNNKHQGILSIYLDQALKSSEIRITGTKSRVRQLVHVSDVVDALLLSIGQVTDNQTFNVLYDELTTPEIIIDCISNKLNKLLTICELDGYIGDQVNITGTNKKLIEIGWQPKIDLQRGVNEFVDNLNI